MLAIVKLSVHTFIWILTIYVISAVIVCLLSIFLSVLWINSKRAFYIENLLKKSFINILMISALFNVQ